MLATIDQHDIGEVSRLLDLPVGTGKSRLFLARQRLKDDPPILLDPAETRALRALVTGVREGRIDLSAAERPATSTPMDLEPLTDIVIAPITIEPLAPQSAQGDRQ